MIIGVLKEPTPETRVSLLPEHLTLLKKWKVETYIESAAGATAFANDDKYREAGATVTSRAEVLKNSDIILSFNTFSDADISSMKKGAVAVGVYQPLFTASLMKDWAGKGLSV